MVKDTKFRKAIQDAKILSDVRGLKVNPIILEEYIADPETFDQDMEKLSKEMRSDEEDPINVLIEGDNSILYKKQMPLVDFCKSKLHFLKWIRCKSGAYNIDYSGEIRHICTLNSEGNILSGTNFFKNITEIKEVLCPEESCKRSEYITDFYKE